MVDNKSRTVSEKLNYNGFELSHIDCNEWVYILQDAQGDFVYVGKSQNVKQRIKDHRANGHCIYFFFYKDYFVDISGFVEFYFINVFRPKENNYDVMHEKVRVDRIVRYFERFTGEEFEQKELRDLFERSNVPYGKYQFYDAYDLLLLMIAYHEYIGSEYLLEDLRSLVVWKDRIKEVYNEETFE